MDVVLNVSRLKCRHASEFRTFNVVKSTTTFEKHESQFLCSDNALLEIRLAKDQDGKWTRLEEETEMGVQI